MGVHEQFQIAERERLIGNFEEIKNARPGSDLHGVLEKTAFHLSLLRPQVNNDKNWFDAQVVLAAYYSQTCIRELFSPYQHVTDHLKQAAKGTREELQYLSQILPLDLSTHTDTMYWTAAQDSIAKSAVSSFKTLYDADMWKMELNLPARVHRQDAA